MATKTKKTDDVPVAKKQDAVVLVKSEKPDVTELVMMGAQSPPVMIINKADRLISKIIKWVGLIALIIFLVTNKPVREKVVSLFESVKKSAENEKDTAVFEWWKEPHQYGQKRSSGPLKAVLTRNDENVFNFELTYFCKNTGGMEKSFFEGEKVSHNRIEGTWSQTNPEDGGHWHLVQDTKNSRLFNGSHNSSKTGDSIKCCLKIKLK